MKKVSRRELARTVAKQLLDGADQKQLLRQVAAYLVEHKMSGQAEMLLQDVAVELQQQTGNVSASVETAFPASAELKTKLSAFVKEVTGASSVELDVTTNPDLLGGSIIRVPGQELDLSVRRKLTSLAKGGA